MRIIGKSKKETEKTNENGKKKSKTPQQQGKEGYQRDLEDLRKEIQESALTLDSYSGELDEVKSELEALTQQTRTAKEELASLKSEILSARAERDMNLEHIKSTKAELEMVTSQYSPQKNRQINDKIEHVRLEISPINSEKGKKVYELDELQSKIRSAKSDLVRHSYAIHHTRLKL